MIKPQIIPYRNKDGFIIASTMPVITYKSYKGVTTKVAALIYCPETEHLKCLAKCAKCPLYAGKVIHKGILCNSVKPFNSGKYYPSRTI